MSPSTGRPAIDAPARSCDAALVWRDLLPHAEPDDLRSWLGERGAFELHRRGVRDVADASAWHAVAAVLAALLGHPSDAIEGVALV